MDAALGGAHAAALAPLRQGLAALQAGLEDCAGVALGLDRLLMVLLDLETIDQVLTFRD